MVAFDEIAGGNHGRDLRRHRSRSGSPAEEVAGRLRRLALRLAGSRVAVGVGMAVVRAVAG